MKGNEYDHLKRVVDIIIGVLLLIISAPPMAVVAILVRRNLGRPVLFKQNRPGKEGRLFTLMKFRSMTTPEPASGLVTDEQRLTRFGSRLRSTSLDELPTLWNVVKGDMSLVGPRPLLVEYLSEYSAKQLRRHEVRPGVTGLAQVSGRNAIGWTERLRLDVEYVDNRSFRLDAKIILKTILIVIRREGVSASDSVTMHRFLGEGGGHAREDVDQESGYGSN